MCWRITIRRIGKGTRLQAAGPFTFPYYNKRCCCAFWLIDISLELNSSNLPWQDSTNARNLRVCASVIIVGWEVSLNSKSEGCKRVCKVQEMSSIFSMTSLFWLAFDQNLGAHSEYSINMNIINSDVAVLDFAPTVLRVAIGASRSRNGVAPIIQVFYCVAHAPRLVIVRIAPKVVS